MSKKNMSSKKEEAMFPFIPVVISSVCATVIYFIFIALFTLISLKSSLSPSLYLPVAIGAGVLSGFTGGFTAGRLIKEKGLFYGGLSGFIHSILCSIIIFILNKGTAGNGIFILIAVNVILASLGGITAVNLKKKIKY